MALAGVHSMTRSTRIRWAWRVALVLPGALCWTAAAFPGALTGYGLLSHRIAHRLEFQIAHGCLVFGQMPDPDALEAWEAAAAERSRLVDEEAACIIPASSVSELIGIGFLCYRARGAGLRMGDQWYRGTYDIVALWLVAIPLTLLWTPLAVGAWTVWRRARRVRSHHCLACGYDLRGLSTLRCPECGLEFAITESALRGPSNHPPPTPAADGRTAAR